jgi:ribosomal protein S7
MGSLIEENVNNNMVTVLEKSEVDYSVELNFWINRLILKKGKLSKVNFLMDKVHFLLTASLNKDSFYILNTGLHNIIPVFLIKNKRRGKKVIISPFFILSPFSRRSSAIKYLIKVILLKKGFFF